MTTLTHVVTTRPAVDGDSPVLREVFVAARPWLQTLAMPAAAVEALVAQQWHAQTSGYATTYPDARDLVLLLDGRPVGRLLVDDGPPVTVVDLAVLPEARGHGVATSALSALLDDADRRSVEVRLTVTPGNPAERLYRRCGFAVTGTAGADLVMTRPAAPTRQESRP